MLSSNVCHLSRHYCFARSKRYPNRIVTRGASDCDRPLCTWFRARNAVLRYVQLCKLFEQAFCILFLWRALEHFRRLYVRRRVLSVRACLRLFCSEAGTVGERGVDCLAIWEGY